MTNRSERIALFDTTLRDGAQMQSVDFSLADKVAIMRALDEFGIDYIEGGWPGANPIDTSLFHKPPLLKHAKLVAFGMTRRAQHSASNDVTLAPLVQAKVPCACLVGKSNLEQVKQILKTDGKENLAMIGDSIAALRNSGKEVFFDAEHFFDGFKVDRDYAIMCLRVAHDAGASDLILCDTNGGMMVEDIAPIIHEIRKTLGSARLGIHAHNDTGQAVAVSHAAISAGVRHVQGTINGIGERCGNANLLTIIANLALKTRFKTNINKDKLASLRGLSQLLDDRLGQHGNSFLPYVGDNAFAHKGGLHGSAVIKNPASYEHVPPESVGNSRSIVMSDQSGRTSLIARLEQYDIDHASLKPGKLERLLDIIKRREAQGMSYQSADASLELLIHSELETFTPPFSVERFRVIDEKRRNARGTYTTESEATVVIALSDRQEHMVTFGDGPVNALDIALRTALERVYPQLRTAHLNDYKVRIMPRNDSNIGTDALTRVTIEFLDQDDVWSCAAISENVIEASLHALVEAYYYRLLKLAQKRGLQQSPPIQRVERPPIA